MSIEFENIQSGSEFIQKASSFISGFGDKPHLTPLVESFVEEANGYRGTLVNLVILNPSLNDNDIEMGDAQFIGLKKDENEKWLAEFTLEPEGIPCPVEVGSYKVK